MKKLLLKRMKIVVVLFALLFSGFAYGQEESSKKESDFTWSIIVPILVNHSDSAVNEIYADGIKLLRFSVGIRSSESNMALEVGYRLGGNYDGTPVGLDGSKIEGAKSEIEISGADFSVLVLSPEENGFCYSRIGYFSGILEEKLEYKGSPYRWPSVSVSGLDFAYGCRRGFSVEIFYNTLKATSSDGYVEGGNLGSFGIGAGFGF